MTKSDAIKHFGSAAKLARALGVTRSAVSQWPERLPMLRQYQVEKISRAVLTVDDHIEAPATKPDVAPRDAA